MPSPFSFGNMLASNTPKVKPAGSPNMLDNMRSSGQLQAGQKFRGGQLVSGPGAKPLSAAQQDDVNFAGNMQAGFNRLNASAGGAGRSGMSKSLAGPPPVSMAQHYLKAMQRAPAPAPTPAPAPASPMTLPIPPHPPSMFQRAMSMLPGSSAMANQTGGGAGPVSAPLSATSTAFNNATGQQDPSHIITTDNGRKFNTQTKTFLDAQPAGFAR